MTKVENPKPVTDALRKRALDLRLNGMSFPAIGKKLSITHPWAAVMSAVKKLDDGERKKVQAQLDKIGVQRSAVDKSKAIAKPAAPTKKQPAIRPVPKPKDVKPVKAAKPKGAPSRIKTAADKAQLSDAELVAEVDAKREQSPLNMTRSEREKLVKAGKLPSADLSVLQNLPNGGLKEPVTA